MTRKEQLQLPAGMGFLLAGMLLQRFGGTSYPVLAIQILFFLASIVLNIRFMLKLREERSEKGGGR